MTKYLINWEGGDWSPTQWECVCTVRGLSPPIPYTHTICATSLWVGGSSWISASNDYTTQCQIEKLKPNWKQRHAISLEFPCVYILISVTDSIFPIWNEDLTLTLARYVFGALHTLQHSCAVRIRMCVKCTMHNLHLKTKKIDHQMIVEFVDLLIRIYGTCVDMMRQSHSQQMLCV